MCSTLQSTIPTPILDDMMHRITNDDYVDYNRYYNMVHMLSRRMNANELERFVDFTEGIEHLWLKSSTTAFMGICH